MLEELMAALKANTAALTANTAALGGKAPAATASTATTAKKTPPKKAPAGPTLETIKEKFGGYLAGVKGQEKATRMANVQTINDHFGVERASLLEPEKFEEALGYLQSYIDGEEPEFAADEGEDADVV